MIINEDSRNQLIAKSKQSKSGGIQRFNRRLKSHVANSTREFNKLNMDDLFKKGILTVSINVKGETNSYLVKISYGGVLDALHNEIRIHKLETIDLRTVIRALVVAFNKNDVYVHCTCPDATYRMNYWQTVNKTSSGQPENRPSDITNPNDTKGSACKHVLLVLSNTSWLIKVASVIKNYIYYIEKHIPNTYANIIYPAIYQKEYEEPTQTSLFDTDELETDEETIDKANELSRTKNRFKPGNKYRFTKQDRPTDEQETMFDNENEEGDIDV